jgi:flagellar biosynthesis protein FlhB
MAGEKSEKPTAKRLKDAKKRGQMARSRDLGDAMHLAVAVLVLSWWSSSMVGGLGTALQEALGRMGQSPLRTINAGEVVGLAVHGVWHIVWLVSPVALGAVVATAAATRAQGGFNLASEAIRFDLTRLSPATGIKKLAPSKAGLDLVKTLVVGTIVGAVAWRAVRTMVDDAPHMALAHPLTAAGIGWDHARTFLVRAVIAMLLLAMADLGLQKWRHLKGLKMTKQEVKDDHKLSEGSPEIKARVRRVQREIARRRMLASVPTATVIITNPTHFAVALKYERGQAAPEVVARGADHLALKIRSLGREHGVPIVENPPLARALYRTTDVGERIPADLFEAVAEVLAYLIRLKQFAI